MRLRYLIPLVVVVGLIAVFAVGLRRNPKLVPSPLIGKPAPAFSLPTLKHASESLTNVQLRGQVSLVNVWASWCVSCRDEAAVLMALTRRGDVPVFGLDYKDERADALKWLSEYGDPYSAIGFDASGNVGINWGVYGVPETFVVDKQGYIRFKHIGPLTSRVVERQILPLVEKLRARP